MRKFKRGDKVILHGFVQDFDRDVYEVAFEPDADGVWVNEGVMKLDLAQFSEPPESSVVEAGGDTVFRRYRDGWYATGSNVKFRWDEILSAGDVRILYDASEA